MTVLIYGILLVLNHGCLQSFLHEPQVLKVQVSIFKDTVMSYLHDEILASFLSFVPSHFDLLQSGRV